MKKIYSKDDCAPDALDAIDWLNNKLGDSPINFLKHPSIEVNHEFNQDRTPADEILATKNIRM
jgi:hypothetical protein